MKVTSAYGLSALLSWHALIVLHLPPQRLLVSPFDASCLVVDVVLIVALAGRRERIGPRTHRLATSADTGRAATCPHCSAGPSRVGRATSGSWSLVLKKNLALGTVTAAAAEIGSELEMEWSVEGERGRIGAQVVELPFFDPPRKRE